MKIHEERSNEYLDPTIYLLEGVGSDNLCTNANYHTVFRIIPDSTFYNICKEFYALQPLNLDYVDENK